MKLIPLSVIEQFLDIEIAENHYNQQIMKKMFDQLKGSNIYDKWKNDDI